MRTAANILAVVTAATLSACSGNTIFNRPDPGQALVRQCLVETGTPGAYSSQSGTEIPVVTPIEKYDGTRRGAATINACIRHKVANGAETRSSSLGKPRTYTYGVPGNATTLTSGRTRSKGICPRHAPVIYGGALYCIGN